MGHNQLASSFYVNVIYVYDQWKFFIVFFSWVHGFLDPKLDNDITKSYFSNRNYFDLLRFQTICNKLYFENPSKNILNKLWKLHSWICDYIFNEYYTIPPFTNAMACRVIGFDNHVADFLQQILFLIGFIDLTIVSFFLFFIIILNFSVQKIVRFCFFTIKS